MVNLFLFFRVSRRLAWVGCALYLGACSSGAPLEQASGGQGLVAAVPLGTAATLPVTGLGREA